MDVLIIINNVYKHNLLVINIIHMDKMMNKNFIIVLV